MPGITSLLGLSCGTWRAGWQDCRSDVEAERDQAPKKGQTAISHLGPPHPRMRPSTSFP